MGPLAEIAWDIDVAFPNLFRAVPAYGYASWEAA